MRIKRHTYRISYKRRRRPRHFGQHLPKVLHAEKLRRIRLKKGQCAKCGTQLKGNGRRRAWYCPKCLPLENVKRIKQIRRWKIMESFNKF